MLLEDSIFLISIILSTSRRYKELLKATGWVSCFLYFQMRFEEQLHKVNQVFNSKDELIWGEDYFMVNRNKLVQGPITSVSVEMGMAIIQKEDSSVIIHDIQNGHQYSLNTIGELIAQDTVLHGRWNDDYSERIVFALNFKTGHTLWEAAKPIGKAYSDGQYFFGANESILSRYDLTTGTVLWSVDLSSYGVYENNGEERHTGVTTFIGSASGVLYFKAGNRLILGVEIDTGNILYEVNYLEDQLVLDNLYIDPENQLIFSIGPLNYIELSLRSPAYELFDISTEVLEHGVQTTNLGSWMGKQVYFWEGSDNNKFGAFNRETKKIEFSHALPEVKGTLPAIRNVVSVGPKVYVHDNKFDLNIFS